MAGTRGPEAPGGANHAARKALFAMGLLRGYVTPEAVAEVEDVLTPAERDVLRYSLRGCGIDVRAAPATPQLAIVR